MDNKETTLVNTLEPIPKTNKTANIGTIGRQIDRSEIPWVSSKTDRSMEFAPDFIINPTSLKKDSKL